MTNNEVLVIFKTHLDVGYTDLSSRVKELYFRKFIRQAVETADAFRKSGTPYRYTWTVGAWLIYEYLARADANGKKLLTDAVRRGDIAYHALPFTMHSELAGKKLFSAGLDLAAALDRKFGRKTLAAKMTDVPGHTRGIIVPLAEHGVRFLQIGVNSATPVPDVPPLFRWVDSSGHSIVVMYQKNYGEMLDFPEYGICAEINVMGDNLGPHPFEQAMDVFRRLERRFPGRAIRSATLDELYEKIRPHEDQLPVVTGEIGDTWIHGVGSDPWKVARLKSLLRSEAFSGSGETVFAGKLLEIVEHTWGLDEKVFLPDAMACEGRALARLKRSPAGRTFAASWAEQRDLLDEAVDSLSAAKKKIALSALQETVPRRIFVSRGGKGAETVRKNAFFSFAFSKEDGSICHWRSRKTGRTFASPAHTLGAFVSRTFTRHEYDHFLRTYLRRDDAWAYLDFGKPFLLYGRQGGTKGIAKSSFRQADENRFLFRLSPERQPGTPETVELEYVFHDESPAIDLTLQWFGKDPARLPHALFLAFLPLLPRDAAWSFCKNGEMIDPQEVVRGGGRSLHAIDEYLEARGSGFTLRIRSLDAVLVSMGTTALLDYTDQLPRKNCGIYFNLYNNKWATNFPMWFGDDMKYRFQLTLEE